MSYDYRMIDDVIHSRVRLAIMSFLATARQADFVQLKKVLKVSDGNLSTHLKKLEEKNYVSVNKQFVDNKPQTSITITKEGEAAFSAYVDGLAAMLGNQTDKKQ